MEAVRRIDAIFGAERDLHGRPVAERLVRRHQIVAPLVAGLERWVAFSRFTGDGRICMTDNAAERALRGIAARRAAALELHRAGCQTGSMSPVSKTPANETSAAESFNQICTVRIELLDTDPLIWREVEVPTSITLKVLHDIVQITMGWLGYHLWEFKIGGRAYGLPIDEDWETTPRTEAIKVRLRDVLEPRKTTIDYLYDFGDS